MYERILENSALAIQNLGDFFQWLFTYDIPGLVYTPFTLMFGAGVTVYAVAVLLKWVLEFIP